MYCFLRNRLSVACWNKMGVSVTAASLRALHTFTIAFPVHAHPRPVDVFFSKFFLLFLMRYLSQTFQQPRGSALITPVYLCPSDTLN